MSNLRCHHSGAPIQVARPQPGRAYFSCTACAIADRIPVDAEGNYPITRALVAVLVAAVVFFNQALFWFLTFSLTRQNRMIAAERFVFTSLALGGALWLVSAIAQWRATGGGRWTDRLVVVLTGLLSAAGVIVGSPGCLVGSVLLLTAWGLRGLGCKQSAT